MRVAVVGCGAIGSLFAAHLGTLEDVEVWAYDVDAQHVDAIVRRGLRVSGAADLHVRIEATTNAAALPACDFGIVATKANHTREALAATAAAFKEGAVCSVQNGVGCEEIIAEYVPAVMRGTAFPAGRLAEPGHVVWDTEGKTSIGPFEPQPAPMEKVERLARTLNDAGLATSALADARGAQWTKLIFNAATNPLGALTRLAHGRVCELDQVRDLASGVVAEGTAVAAALGIALDDDPDALIDHAAVAAYDHQASMLQDVLAGRPTEIDFINGGICTFGEQTGVPTPLNQALWALVRGLEYSFAASNDD